MQESSLLGTLTIALNTNRQRAAMTINHRMNGLFLRAPDFRSVRLIAIGTLILLYGVAEARGSFGLFAR